jgi:hypothetical protein
VPPEDFPRALELAPRIVSALRAAGYLHVALDLAGYRPGSLNASLGRTGATRDAGWVADEGRASNLDGGSVADAGRASNLDGGSVPDIGRRSGVDSP